MSEIGSIDGPTYLKLLHEHAALKAENEKLQAKYDTLLRDSYAITMNACKCGRGKRPGYELCKVCRIAELEDYQDRAGKVLDKNIDTMLAQNERISELETELKEAQTVATTALKRELELKSENEAMKEYLHARACVLPRGKERPGTNHWDNFVLLNPEYK